MRNLMMYILSSIALISCGTFNPIDTPSIQHYIMKNSQINYSNCNALSDIILQILPTQANAPYNSYNMYYSKNNYLLETYSYSQWATLPQNTINQAIWQASSTSCIFKNIVGADVVVATHYRLYSRILKLQQNITDNKSTAEFSILIQLINNDQNTIVGSNIFNENSIIKTSPNGMAEGFSYNLQQFSEKLHNWLIKQKATLSNGLHTTT